MTQRTAANLFNALVSGGIKAPSASEIANAIGNQNTSQKPQSASFSDATNKPTLKFISANSRRYDLTNLDFRHEQAYQTAKVQVARRTFAPAVDHPYRDSQPQLVNSPISASPIATGAYLKSVDAVSSSAIQTTISINFGSQLGDFLRLNKATQSIDAVPLIVKNTTNIPLNFSFSNTEQGVELLVSGRNLVEFEFAGAAVVSIGGLANSVNVKALCFKV